jgi:hypothetical protein
MYFFPKTFYRKPILYFVFSYSLYGRLSGTPTTILLLYVLSGAGSGRFGDRERHRERAGHKGGGGQEIVISESSSNKDLVVSCSSRLLHLSKIRLYRNLGAFLRAVGKSSGCTNECTLLSQKHTQYPFL